MRGRRWIVVACASWLAGCAAARPPTGSAPSDEIGRTEAAGSSRDRQSCRLSFAACAPPLYFGSDVDVEGLDPRMLVRVASRLDVTDALAEAAAKRLGRLIEEAELPLLLEISEAEADTERTLRRCRCEGVESAYERRGLGGALARRLPAVHLRSPGHWKATLEEILASIRELQRSAALAVVAGASGAELEGRREAAERDLCEAVHAARAHLARPAFEEVLEEVVRDRALQEGAASAAAARKAFRDHRETSSCGPPLAGADAARRGPTK